MPVSEKTYCNKKSDPVYGDVLVV